MKPVEGDKILVYGQKVTITEVVNVDGETRVYLDHPIVVPEVNYTRDCISVDEIQKYIEFNVKL